MRRNVSRSARSHFKVGTGSKRGVAGILRHVATDSRPEGGGKHGPDGKVLKAGGGKECGEECMIGINATENNIGLGISVVHPVLDREQGKR